MFAFPLTFPTSFHLKIIFHLFVLLVISVIGASAPPNNVIKQLKFVPWGHPCKIPFTGEFLKPNERCNETAGMVCQKYTLGEYCGCRQTCIANCADTSYDIISKECRLKVGQFCHFIGPEEQLEYYSQLPFNVKCHENAQCTLSPGILKYGRILKPDEATCVCKNGFFASTDFTQCSISNNPNLSATNLPSHWALFLIPMQYHFFK